VIVVKPRFGAPKSVFPIPVDPWKSWPPSRVRVAPRRFATPLGAAGFSSVVGVPAWAPMYAPAPVVVSTPPVVLPPPAPPTPTTIEYATGWYQLRGDGVILPYTWVWVPKPPPPPVIVPEPVPLPTPPPAAPSPSSETPPAPRSEAYRWTDEGGVTTWTNRLDRVPRRYRDQAAASIEP
jgi:hypothetical protein